MESEFEIQQKIKVIEKEIQDISEQREEYLDEMAKGKRLDLRNKIRQVIKHLQEEQDKLREQRLSLNEKLDKYKSVRRYLKENPTASSSTIASIIDCDPNLVIFLRHEMVACGEISQDKAL
jgi:uncharacterized coiled-coil DUF342 family protein